MFVNVYAYIKSSRILKILHLFDWLGWDYSIWRLNCINYTLELKFWDDFLCWLWPAFQSIYDSQMCAWRIIILVDRPLVLSLFLSLALSLSLTVTHLHARIHPPKLARRSLFSVNRNTRITGGTRINQIYRQNHPPKFSRYRRRVRSVEQSGAYIVVLLRIWGHTRVCYCVRYLLVHVICPQPYNNTVHNTNICTHARAVFVSLTSIHFRAGHKRNGPTQSQARVPSGA